MMNPGTLAYLGYNFASHYPIISMYVLDPNNHGFRMRSSDEGCARLQ